MAHRVRRICAALLLAGAVSPASADPVSVSAFLVNAAYATQIVAFSTTAYAAAQAALLVGGTLLAKRAQRKAAAQSRASFNASLQDRLVTIRSAISVRPVIYGRTSVGGSLVFAHVTGDKGQFLHLVIAIAGHRCDAIEQVWFGDTLLPTPDASGFIQSGPFSRSIPTTGVSSSTTTTINLGVAPQSIESVTRTRGAGIDAETTQVTEGSGYTVAGAVVTIVSGHLAGDTYTVNWTSSSSAPRVRIKRYLGAPGQVADPDLIAEAPGVWLSSDVGNSVTYVYARLEYDQEIFGQTSVPDMRFVVRGKLVFDPRTSTTGWSQNAALCTRDYLLDTVHGIGSAAGEVVSAEAITAANICDEWVLTYNAGTATATNGFSIITSSTGGQQWLTQARPGMFMRMAGTDYLIASVQSNNQLTLATPYSGTSFTGAYGFFQRRYQCDGVLSTATSAWDNLQLLTSAMAGSVVYVQGRWLIRAGAGRVTEMTITADHLAEGEIIVQPRASRSALFNAVTGTFLDPEKLYAESQWPEVRNATYQTQDGGQRLARELELPLTQNPIAAQRLAKITLERSRQALTIKLSTNLRAYDLVPTDWVAITLARYGWSGKVFEVLERSWSPGQAVQYTLREVAATAYDWALGEQTTLDLAPNTALPNPYAPPAALNIGSVLTGTAQLLRLADGTIITRGLVSWTQTADIFVLRGGRIEIEWKLDSDTDWQAAPSEPGDATNAIIGPLADNRLTLVRVRAVNSLGRTGPWTTTVVLVIGKTALPAAVTGLTAAMIPGAVRINVAPTTELDVTTLRLKRGASWAAGTRLDGTAGWTEVDSNTIDWAWPAFGAYTIWAAWVDTSGNEGPPVSTAITVTAAGISIGASGISAQIGGGNVLANAGFEADTNADGVADYWGIYQAGSTGVVTYSRQTVDGVAGAPYQRVAASALALSGAFIGVNNGGNRSITLPDAGGAVTTSAYVRVGGTGSLVVAFYIEFKNAAGAIIGSANPSFTGISGSWVRINHTAAAPAGTKSIFFYCWLSVGAGASAVLDVSRCQVEPGDLMTAFAPRVDELLPGVVGTNEIYPGAATVVSRFDYAGGVITAVGSAGNASASVDTAVGSWLNDSSESVEVSVRIQQTNLSFLTGSSSAGIAYYTVEIFRSGSITPLFSDYTSQRHTAAGSYKPPKEGVRPYLDTFLIPSGETITVTAKHGIIAANPGDQTTSGIVSGAIEVIKR